MRVWVKVALFASLTGAIGLVLYSRLPSICTSEDFILKSARGGVMALLPQPGKARFHDNHVVTGVGTDDVTVAGTFHTKDPADGGKRKSYEVKLSCGQYYMRVQDAHVVDQSAPGDG